MHIQHQIPGKRALSVFAHAVPRSLDEMRSVITMDNSAQLQTGFECAWLQTLAHGDTQFGAIKPPDWVPRTLIDLRRTPALDMALQATAITMVGRLRNDAAAITYGLLIHGRALISLQRDLYDPTVAHTDATLAACQTLKYFEVREANIHPCSCHTAKSIFQLFESTSGSAAGFLGHTQGLVSLLEHRGPTRNSSAVSRDITREIRFSAVCRVPSQQFIRMILSS